MTDEKITHLIINYIRVEPNLILVGVTDNERWRWDIEDGMSGADAKTLAYVTLTDNGKGYAISEEAGFHCSPGDPTRALCMLHISELFDIAWIIKNEKLDSKTAKERYFGAEIK